MTHADTNTASRSARLRLSAALLSLVLLLMMAPRPAHAQVEGISYTISPTGQYVFFESDIFEENNSGLEDGFLYGGEVGLGFGQYLTLSGLYMLGDNFETNFGNFDIDDPTTRQQAILDALDSLSTRDVDLKRYGGEIKLNLGSGVGETAEFQPYVTLGAGVLEIDPENRPVTETIYATGGLGFTFALLDRFTVSVGGEVLAYRYNLAQTFLTDNDISQINAEAGFTGDDQAERDDFNQVTVYNPSLRASVEFFLGGRRPGELSDLDRAFMEQFRDGGTQIFVQPFFGRIEFNDALGFPKDQNVAGINAGIELGPFVALRGFYWRGVSGDDVFDEVPPDNFEDIAFFGGELGLRFDTQFGSRGFVPFAIVGGGYMDVLSDFEDDLDEEDADLVPDDRYFATAGGGLEIPLSNALKLQGGARYLFMSNTDVEDLSDPDNVYGSLMYSAGLEFSLGGGRGRSPAEILEERREEDLREMTARERRREQATLEEIQRLQARIDSLERAARRQEQTPQQQTPQQQELEELRQDVQRLEREEQQMRQEERLREEDRRRRGESNLSNETITLPIPEVGEVYIRVGETAEDVQVETQFAPPTVIQGGQAQGGGFAGQPSAAQIRQMIQEEMRQAQTEGRALSEQDIQRIVRETIQSEIRAAGGQVPSISNQAILEQLEDEREERRELARRLERLRQEMDQELDEQQRRRATPEVIVEEDEDGETQTTVIGGRYAPNRVVPTAGYTFGDANRFLVGVRGDYGSDTGFGVGGYDFRFMPEVMVGFGDGASLDLLANAIVDFDVLERYIGASVSPYLGAGVGLTTEVGFGINLLLGGEYEIGSGAAFVEFSTVSFFDYNRFLIGYRTRF